MSLKNSVTRPETSKPTLLPLEHNVSIFRCIDLLSMLRGTMRHRPARREQHTPLVNSRVGAPSGPPTSASSGERHHSFWLLIRQVAAEPHLQAVAEIV